MKDSTNEIYQVIYRSEANKGLQSEEIAEIVDVARRRNSLNGITGLLIVRGKFFIQLLEGERSSVLETMRRIEKDKRHTKIQILLEGSPDKRLFEKWAMGLVDEGLLDSTTPEALHAIDDIVQSAGNLHTLIIKVLKIFSTDVGFLNKNPSKIKENSG